MKMPFAIALNFLFVASLIAEDAVVSLRTFSLGGGEMPESIVRVTGETELAKLEWPTSQPSAPIPAVPNGGKLQMLGNVTGPDGETALTVISSVGLPAGAKEILLMGWMTGGEARYVAISDTFLNAKFNDWLAINTTRQPVALLAGDGGKPVKIEAGSSLIFQPRVKAKAGAEIVAKTLIKGEVKTFFSTYWPVFDGQRTLIIFYKDGERMRARRISDHFARKKADQSDTQTLSRSR